MRKATKRLPVPRDGVEILTPVSKAQAQIARYALAQPARTEDYEEIIEETKTRTVRRKRVETAPATSRSDEPIGSIVSRVFAITFLVVIVLVCAGLSVFALAMGDMAMSVIAFISTIGLTFLTVSTARYQH